MIMRGISRAGSDQWWWQKNGDADDEKNTGWKRRLWSRALIVIDTGDTGRGGARCGVGHLRRDGHRHDFEMIGMIVMIMVIMIMI